MWRIREIERFFPLDAQMLFGIFLFLLLAVISNFTEGKACKGTVSVLSCTCVRGLYRNIRDQDGTISPELFRRRP